MTIRIEAEAFAGVGAPRNFAASALEGASGGGVIGLKPGRTGGVTTTAGVAAGLYKLRVVYHDETDGVTMASVAVDGVTHGAWAFDGVAGAQVVPGGRTGAGAQPGNLRSITLDGVVALDADSVLTLAATQNGGEAARFDFIELIEVFAPTDLTLAGPAAIGQGIFGATVGALRVTDADGGGPATYTVDDARFAVVDGVLRLRADVSLDAGSEPEVMVTVTATDADGLTYAESFSIGVLEAPPPAPDLSLTALDLPTLPGRLVFSFIERPGGRAVKDTGYARIDNTGDAALVVEALELDGFFALLDPTLAAGFVVAAGESVTIGVRFDRTAYTPKFDPAVFHGALRVISSDADEPVAEIALGGFWSPKPEGGNEASANETFAAFGFGNRIPTKPSGRDLPTDYRFEASSPEEILSPFWRIADGVETMTITRIGGFVTSDYTDFGIYNPDSNGQRSMMLGFGKEQNSRFLPRTTAGGEPTLSFTRAQIPDAWEHDDVFGFVSANTYSNHNANGGRGHGFRIWQALDGDGAPIENTWLGTQDGVYGNEDFNDSIFLMTGIAPVFGIQYGSGGNDTLRGTALNDSLAGEAGHDILYGFEGDDFMIGDGGADTFEGGEGRDTVSYKWSFGVTANLATGLGHEGDVYRSIEALVGSGGNDRLTASNAGSTLEGAAGADTLTGGTGFDTVSYAGSNAAVSVNLSNNAVSGGHAGGDVLSGIEGVIGSAFNDTLTGSAGVNTLFGGAGADRLTGGGGADVFAFGFEGPNGAGDVITDLALGDRVRVAGASALEQRAEGVFLAFGGGAFAYLAAPGANVVDVTDTATPVGSTDYALV